MWPVTTTCAKQPRSHFSIAALLFVQASLRCSCNRPTAGLAAEHLDASLDRVIAIHPRGSAQRRNQSALLEEQPWKQTLGSGQKQKESFHNKPEKQEIGDAKRHSLDKDREEREGKEHNGVKHREHDKELEVGTEQSTDASEDQDAVQVEEELDSEAMDNDSDVGPNGKRPKELPWPSPMVAAAGYSATLALAIVASSISMLCYMGAWPYSLFLSDPVTVTERVQGYALSDRFFGNFIYSIVLPDSLGLSSAMSEGATFSGWIIGIYKGLSLVGLAFGLLLCSSRNKGWIRNIYPCIVTGKATAFLGSAVFLVIVIYRDTIPHAKNWLLLSRAVAGVGNGIVMIPVELIFVHTTSPEERHIMLSRAVFNVTLGIGLGPLVASVMRTMYSSITGTSQGEIEIIMALPVVVSFVGLVAVYFIEGGEKFVHHTAAPELPAPEEYLEAWVEKEDYNARRIGIIGCGLIVGLRATVCAGLEAATGMILEADFAWSKNSVGIAIGLSFMVAVPGRMIFMYLKDILTVAEQIRYNMLTSVLVSIFLFKEVQNFIMWGSGGSPTELLSAGSILYCAIYQVSGLVEGIMTTFALPTGSIFTVDNVILFKLIMLDSVGRTFGPPLARMQVEAGGKENGQDCYAWQQLSMTLLATLLTEAVLLRTMDAVREGRKSSLGVTDEKIKAFFAQPMAGDEAPEQGSSAGAEQWPPSQPSPSASPSADDTDA